MRSYPGVVAVPHAEVVPGRAVAGHLHVLAQSHRELRVAQLQQVRVGAVLVAKGIPYVIETDKFNKFNNVGRILLKKTGAEVSTAPIDLLLRKDRAEHMSK